MTLPDERARPVEDLVGQENLGTSHPYLSIIPPEIATAVMGVRPVCVEGKGDYSTDQQTCASTAYELCRALRAAQGDENNRLALLPDIDSLEAVVEHYAKRHHLPFDLLITELEIQWVDSYGPHRNPWIGAIQQYQRNPQLIRLSTRNESLNKLATLAYCLHESVGHADFALPCSKAGEVVGLSKMQVSRLILLLVGRGILKRVCDASYEGTNEGNQAARYVMELPENMLRNVTHMLRDVTHMLPINLVTEELFNLVNVNCESEPENGASLSTLTPAQFLILWNKLADDCGVPKARRIDGDRLKDFKNRAKDPNWETECLEVLDKIRNSPYLQGKVPGKPWKVSIDWILDSDNFAKIIEGNYDNNTPAAIQLGSGVQNEGDEPW